MAAGTRMEEDAAILGRSDDHATVVKHTGNALLVATVQYLAERKSNIDTDIRISISTTTR